MGLNITSDLKTWVAVAYIDNGDGTCTLRPEAEAYVVLGSLSVGMFELNERTADEWLARLRAWEIVDGPMMRVHDAETNDYIRVPVTMDALRPYFGTRTNNFPAETRAKFTKRVGLAVMERVEREGRRERHEAIALAAPADEVTVH